MATTSTGFSPSVYDAENAMLDLADTYLTPGSYSTLKSGFLGYMTGGMSRIAAEGAHHRNILFHENFLNTASLPRSIYNYAKIYDYSVGLSTPSSCRVLVGVYLDEVRSALGSETGTIRFPRSQPVYFGSTQFMLAGAVTLTVLEDSRVAAEYDLTDMDFVDTNQQSYIRTYVTPQVVDANGTTRTVIYMEVRVHQAIQQAIQFQVVSVSALETSFYTVAIPDGQQLVSFRVMYKTAADATYRELETIFNEASTPTTSEYCYYSYNSDSELDIYFSPLPGSFRPAYNSNIRVVYLTSTGISGNFDFTGTPVLTLDGVTLTTLVELVTQPAGGYDRETLIQVKKGILRKILERKSIIMESDLDSYLSGAVDKTKVNESLLTFIKRRDDIQSRLFASYLMLRDSANRIVPTNTASIDFEAMDLETRGWSLKPGTLIMYDRANSLYRLIAAGEYPDKMVTDPNSFIYAVPFLMQFRTSPFPRMVYYSNYADIDAPLSALAGAKASADSFIANSVTIKRNSVFDSNYQIDLALSSNLSADGLGAKCLVRVILMNSLNQRLGYAEATHLSGTNIFRASIQTQDQFDESSNLIISNSLWNESTDTLMPSVSIPEDVYLRLELYYDSSDPDTSVTYVQRGNRIFQLTHAFATTTAVNLYKSLERVMSSGMYVTTEGTFHCDGVPLIGASFFLNPRIGVEILNIANTYHSAILDIFDLLHNNTSVDVKFYNTYGPSKLFNLDRPNISLVLDVRSKGRISTTLKDEIRSAVAKFVQSCNDNDRSRFSISNLTTYLEQNITDIAFVRFVSMNGVASQNAEMIYSSAALTQDNKRIPEYINVTTLLQSSLDTDPYVPDVTINFI